MANGIRVLIGLVAVALVTSCASSGIMTIDKDTYMITKRSAQVGFGPPVAATAYVYKEANAYCGNLSKKVETLKLDQVDSGFGRPSSASLQFRCVEATAKPAGEQCKSEMDVPELDPIRQKVQLYRASMDEPVPFAIAANDTFPTDAEKPVIAKWATLRDECLKRDASTPLPPTANAMQVAFIQQERAFGRQAGARVGDLILALYQQKLTYGEFAHKRYEIGRDAAAAELAFRQSALDQDQQRQMQAQQMAQQQFANQLAAWSTYMQAVNARQPQTVHIDGAIRVVQ